MNKNEGLLEYPRVFKASRACWWRVHAATSWSISRFQSDRLLKIFQVAMKPLEKTNERFETGFLTWWFLQTLVPATAGWARADHCLLKDRRCLTTTTLLQPLPRTLLHGVSISRARE